MHIIIPRAIKKEKTERKERKKKEEQGKKVEALQINLIGNMNMLNKTCYFQTLVIYALGVVLKDADTWDIPYRCVCINMYIFR